MKITVTLTILVSLLLTLGSSAQGLDCSPAGVMISHGHPKGGWMLTYTYMKSDFKGNIDGTAKVSDEKIFENYLMSPQTMTMDMHMLMGMYGLGARLSLMGMLSYSKMDMNMNMLPGSVHVHGSGATSTQSSTTMTMNSSGLNDAKIWALYKLSTGEGSSLVGSLGCSFPLGNINLEGDVIDMFIDQHLPYGMQLGTGTLDFMPGITYFKRSRKNSFSVQTMATIRPFKNVNDYAWGNDVTINLWAARQLKPWVSLSLRSETYLSGAIRGADVHTLAVMEPDANPANYGGLRNSLLGGFNFYCNSGFMRDSKAGVEFGLPVYQNLNGPQLSSHFSLLVGITKSF